LAPSLRVAAQIGPYFVLALDGGVAAAFGLGSRLAQFSLATPSALVVLTGPSCPAHPAIGERRHRMNLPDAPVAHEGFFALISSALYFRQGSVYEMDRDRTFANR
jgi:hypothetical protein